MLFRELAKRPFRNLEKGTGESAARSDSLSNKRETRGILGKIKEKSTKNGMSSSRGGEGYITC